MLLVGRPPLLSIPTTSVGVRRRISTPCRAAQGSNGSDAAAPSSAAAASDTPSSFASPPPQSSQSPSAAVQPRGAALGRTLPYIIGQSASGQATASSRPSRLSTDPPESEYVDGHFGGALTISVFGAALLSERLNGDGIVHNLELHNAGYHPLLLATIALLLVAAAWPEKRELGSPSLLVRVQMGAARVAYLGLAASIAAEMFTGKGVLQLLDFETGIEAVSDIEAVLAFVVMLFLTGPQSRTIK